VERKNSDQRHKTGGITTEIHIIFIQKLVDLDHEFGILYKM
jgi:hypothetical protein